MEVVIIKSTKTNKQYDAIVNDTETVSFGQKGASDFTKHKNTDRKDRCIARHKKSEDHGLRGVKTAGFWSANLLWNKPTLKTIVDEIDKKLKSLNVKMKWVLY